MTATTQTDEHASQRSGDKTKSIKTFNDWFLGLPAERQAILREDKWMMAEAAFHAGFAAGRSSHSAYESL